MNATLENGLDEFKNAIRLIVCPRQITEALYGLDSAAKIIKEFKPDITSVLPEDINPPLGAPKSYTLDRLYNPDEKIAVLRANKTAVEKIEESLESEWPEDMAMDDGEKIVIYTALRLLALKGIVSELSTKYSDAAESMLNGIDITQRIMGLDIIEMLMRHGPLDAYCSKLQELEVNLTASDKMHVLDRLAKLSSEARSYRSVWESEKKKHIDHIKEMCSNPFWKITAAMYMPSRSSMLSKLALTSFCSKERYIAKIDNDFEEYFKQMENSAASGADTGVNGWDTAHLSLTPDFLFRIREYVLRGRVKLDLLMLQLALGLYKETKGAYPESLQDLVDGYIKELPKDPFSDDDIYQYEIKDDKFTLSSVNPKR